METGYYQGELVDRVEYHVSQTTEVVDEARSKLVIAEQYQTKARKVRFPTDQWSI